MIYLSRPDRRRSTNPTFAPIRLRPKPQDKVQPPRLPPHERRQTIGVKWRGAARHRTVRRATETGTGRPTPSGFIVSRLCKCPSKIAEKPSCTLGNDDRAGVGDPL